MLDEQVIRCRDAKTFESRYDAMSWLNKISDDLKIKAEHWMKPNIKL